MPAINFFSEDVQFEIEHPRKTSRWIKASISTEKAKFQSLNFIFCSDKYLLKINEEYLNHDTLTDIITFDQSEEDGVVQGDIFISIDRIKENSVKFGVDLNDELHRVIIHGVLHLLGYRDKNSSDKTLMREKEDRYLSLRS
jgi:probable rRNA maturation factor